MISLNKICLNENLKSCFYFITLRYDNVYKMTLLNYANIFILLNECVYYINLIAQISK